LGRAELQVVAYEDGPAPNVPGQPGAQFAILEGAALNQAGELAFWANLDHFSISDDKAAGIWFGTKDQLLPIAREGDFAPGTPYPFENFSNLPLLSDGGHVLFRGELDTPSSASARDEGIWLNTPTGLKLVAQKGVSTGGTPFVLESIPGITRNGDYALGDGGHVAFQGRLSNAANSLWFGTPEQMSVVAYDDMLLPAGTGFGSGYKFASLDELGPAVSADGKLAFQATVSSPASGSSRDTIWLTQNNTLQLVASSQTAAPGVVGSDFRSFVEPVMNNAGQVAFEADLTGFVESLWRGTPGNLQVLLREGDPAPVGVPGAVFVGSDTFSKVRFNDAGELAFVGQFFYAGVPPNNNTGLFVVGDEGVRLVALEGDVGSIANFAINNAGEVAFVTLSDSVYATDPRGELNLVRDPGSAGDDHVFHSGSLTEAEFSSPWNSSFQLAFATRFATSNRIYLATISVPEASTTSLVITAAIMMCAATRMGMASCAG
jgi:hypothetical protein